MTLKFDLNQRWMVTEEENKYFKRLSDFPGLEIIISKFSSAFGF